MRSFFIHLARQNKKGMLKECKFQQLLLCIVHSARRNGGQIWQTTGISKALVGEKKNNTNAWIVALECKFSFFFHLEVSFNNPLISQPHMTAEVEPLCHLPHRYPVNRGILGGHLQKFWLPGGRGYCHIIWGNIGMCCCEGYGFQATYPGIGYRNHRVWVQNRVSFSRISTVQLDEECTCSLD